jgi:prepilin-type N-terminal cleavage/methylation domain-containing protein
MNNKHITFELVAAENKSVKNKGFTLVELAIVIVIIGLLVGGVLQGQELIKQSQIRKLVTDIQSYDTALNIFRSKFNCIPGDCANATRFFPTSVNGDGNQYIYYIGPSSDSESRRAWHQLALSGIIKGSYSIATETPKANINTPTAPCCGNAVYVARETEVFNTQKINGLEIGGESTSVFAASFPRFDVDFSRQVDLKIDDGVANRGILFAMDGEGVVANSCSAPFFTIGGADYNTSSSGINCRLTYKLSIN